MENYFGDDGDGVAGTNVTRVADSDEEKAEMTANRRNWLRERRAPPSSLRSDRGFPFDWFPPAFPPLCARDARFLCSGESPALWPISAGPRFSLPHTCGPTPH